MDFFLLDTNFFREATKAPNNELLARVIPALRQRGFDFGEVGSAIRISPFSLLEALGIVVKMPPGRTFLVAGRDPKEVFSEIFHYAAEHFRSLPELKAAHIQQKHDEQLAYLSGSGRPLFDVCVTGVLARVEEPVDLFASFLGMDYFVKHPFSPDDFQSMAQFLVTLFFMDLPEHSPTSRYRMSMRMFNQLKGGLLAVPEHEAEIAAHRLKNDRDLLDTEIVQEVTYGFPLDGERHRVVALTFDSADVVRRRARFHRQVGLSVGRKYLADPKMAEVAQGFLTHPGGVIIQVDKAGSIVELIDLRETFAQLKLP